MTSAPEGSYTKRLFHDADLLGKKIVEEAIELKTNLYWKARKTWSWGGRGA